MDLCRCQVGGGVELQFIGVIGGAIGKGDRPNLAARRCREVCLGPGDDAAIGRLEIENRGAGFCEVGVGFGAGQLAGGHQRFGLGLYIGPER